MEDPSQQHGPRKRSDPAQMPPAGSVQPDSGQVLREGLPTGTGLGKYRILERLYSTYNGAVYKARDMMLDRLVTIKQMTPALLDDPIACGLFKREAQFLARVPRGAKHIVNIHELIELERGLFIVGEYVNGQWLESLISKRLMDVMGALRILRTAVTGLRTLHGLDVVHRGIHPHSLMVTKSNKAMITNLGTAAHEGDTTPAPVLFAQYTAPEILAGRVYDNRVDIYSLGMTLYEYCVGRRTMIGILNDTAQDAVSGARLWTDWQRDLDRALPDASELNPSIPVALSSILRRMTAKQLDERYSSCQQVLDALDRHFEIRRGSPARLQVGISFGFQTQRPAQPLGRMTTTQPINSPLLPYQAGNQPPPLAPATSTHTARRTITQQTQPQPEVVPPGVRRPNSPSHGAAPPRKDSRRVRQVRTLRTPPKTVRPEAIPALKEVREVHKSRKPRVLAWTIASVLTIAACSIGGYALWYHTSGPGLTSPIEQIYADAMAAYEDEQYETARLEFEQAASFDVSARKFLHIREDAENWLLLASARVALERDNFEEAMRHVRDAQKRGANPAEVDEIKRKCWAKKDAYRLMAGASEDLERGQSTEAEMKIEALEERAELAGVDTQGIKARLEMSREDVRYREALKRAREALNRGDFDAASLACVEAQRIRETTETSKLSKLIQDEKRKARLVLQGKDAMLNRDYAAAAEAYEAANQLGPTREIEEQARVARAFVLIERAQERFDAGEILAAKQDLLTSMWKYPTPQAKAKLSKLEPAFAAADLAARADRQLSTGNYAEAVRLYREALPDLPPPANTAVEQRLRDARGGLAVKQADEAFKAGDWESALKKYQEAKALGRNGDLDWKIRATQKKLGATSKPTSASALP